MQKTNENQRKEEEEEEEEEVFEKYENNLAEYAEFTSADGWEETPRDIFTVLAMSEAFKIKLLEDNLNGHILQNQKQKQKTYSRLQTQKAHCHL